MLIVVRPEKTFERLVHLPRVASHKRAPSAAGGLGKAELHFSRVLRPSFLLLQTPAFYSNHRQLEHILTQLATPMLAQRKPSLF
jgi:hypothetical protein